jgi:hypothetical protein
MHRGKKLYIKKRIWIVQRKDVILYKQILDCSERKEVILNKEKIYYAEWKQVIIKNNSFLYREGCGI